MIENSLWALPWALFRRWCHLMGHIVKFNFHRGLTYTTRSYIFPLGIECDCGRVFWSRY